MGGGERFLHVGTGIKLFFGLLRHKHGTVTEGSGPRIVVWFDFLTPSAEKDRKSALRTSAGFLFPSIWLILFFISIFEAQQQKEQQKKDENKRRTSKQRYKDKLLIHRVSGHH